MATEYELREMQPDHEFLDSDEFTMATEYEMLKMQPDRGLLKCVVCVVVLVSLALTGPLTSLQSDVASDVPSVSVQDEESEAIID